ncbi:hypothetical protein Bca101_024278 [Brassica carinata]
MVILGGPTVDTCPGISAAPVISNGFYELPSLMYERVELITKTLAQLSLIWELVLTELRRGNLWFLINVVRKAEQQLISDSSRVKEYLPIVGFVEFNKLSVSFLIGVFSRVVYQPCISTSYNRGVFVWNWFPESWRGKTIYITQPTWGNHPKIFTLAGLSVKTYRYYDPSIRGLNFQGEFIRRLWQLMRSKGLVPFFDSAYQGFASGSLDTDAKPSRMFVADRGECLVAQSYAKNMGLYGDRVGALSIVCKSADVAGRVKSQLKLVIRPMYSNPPIHGASIVAVILRDRNLFNEWTLELKAMADRIISMRNSFSRHYVLEGRLETGVTS